MAKPLHIIMIMHDLLHKLKTSVVVHANIPCAPALSSSRTLSEASPLQDTWYAQKLSNLTCLARCGFYDHLEEDRWVCPNMGV